MVTQKARHGLRPPLTFPASPKPLAKKTQAFSKAPGLRESATLSESRLADGDFLAFLLPYCAARSLAARPAAKYS